MAAVDVPDNRGSKLVLLAGGAVAPAQPRDPLRRVRGPLPDDESGAAAVEAAFTVAQHMRKEGAGLSAGESRLLLGGWARWAEDASGLRVARGLPGRWLSAAADAPGVRDALGAGAVLRQSHDLMAGIEDDWRRLVALRRLSAALDDVLAPAEHPDAGAADAPAENGKSGHAIPDLNADDRAALERTRALCALLAERTRAQHARLADVRADLERAARLARLVGRFLVKRHRRIVGSMSTNI